MVKDKIYNKNYHQRQKVFEILYNNFKNDVKIRIWRSYETFFTKNEKIRIPFDWDFLYFYYNKNDNTTREKFTFWFFYKNYKYLLWTK